MNVSTLDLACAQRPHWTDSEDGITKVLRAETRHMLFTYSWQAWRARVRISLFTAQDLSHSNTAPDCHISGVKRLELQRAEEEANGCGPPMFSSNFVKWELLAAAPWPAAGARVSHLHEQDFGAPDLRSLYGILDCSPFSVLRLLHVWEGIYFLCGYFLQVIVCLGKKKCQIYYNIMVLIYWKATVWETEKLQSNVIGSADQSKTELSLPFYLLVPLFFSFWLWV